MLKKLPKNINILGRTVKVKPQYLSDCFGSFNTGTETIIIANDISFNQQLCTLLHEIMEYIAADIEVIDQLPYGKDIHLEHMPIKNRDTWGVFCQVLFDTLVRNKLIELKEG